MAVGHILCTLLSNQQRRALPAFLKWGSRPFLEIEAGKGTQNDERAPAPRPHAPEWIATAFAIQLDGHARRTSCDAPGTRRAADHLWDMSSAPARGCRWHVPARRAPTPGGSGRLRNHSNRASNGIQVDQGVARKAK